MPLIPNRNAVDSTLRRWAGTRASRGPVPLTSGAGIVNRTPRREDQSCRSATIGSMLAARRVGR